MAHMSYTGASVAAPASGTDKSYVFFRAIFDHILATFNADDDTLTAATSGTGAGVGNSQLVKRDAKGGANFGANASITTATLSAVAPDNATYALYLRVFAGGLHGIRMQNQAGNADLFTADASGNGFFAGTLTLGSGPTTVTDAAGKILAAAMNTVDFAHGGTGLTTAAAATVLRSTGSAWAAVAGLIFPEIVSDYRLAASGVAGQVNVSAGSQYGDSLGGIVGPLTAQAVVLPAQPSGTNVQYHMISLVPGSGAPHVDSGPASATGLPLPSPAYTVGNAFVGTVKRRGATTNPSDLIIASDITNALVGAGGGGGTGGSGSIAAAGWTNGAPGSSMPNGLDSTSASANGFHNANLIKYNLSDASIINIIKSAVTGNIVDRVGASGGDLVLTIDPNRPVSVALSGYGSRTNTATTSTAGNGLTAGSSSAGAYHLVADLNTALVSTFTLKVVSSVGAGQVDLAIVWWDGNQYQLGGSGNNLGFIAYPFLPKPLVRKIVIPQQAYTATTLPGDSGAAFHAWPTGAAFTIYLPLAGMRGAVTFEAPVKQASTSVAGAVGVVVQNAATLGTVTGLAQQFTMLATFAAATWITAYASYDSTLLGLSAGPYTFVPGYLNTGAGGFDYTTGAGIMRGEFDI
jgi:hypothetical protein